MFIRKCKKNSNDNTSCMKIFLNNKQKSLAVIYWCPKVSRRGLN